MNYIFWIAALVALINSISFTILIPVIYLYGKEFGLSDFHTSLLFSTYAIAQFFATPVIGKLADRFGRKPLLIISLAGTVIANIVAGTATTFIPLFIGRFLDGITGGNVSVSQAVIADMSTPQNRAKAFGIYGAAMGLGFVLGPVISLFAQQISLGTAFLFSASFAFIGMMITIIFLPETLPQEISRNQPKFDIFDLGLDKLITGFSIPGVGILLLVNFLTGTTFTMFTYAFQPYFIQVLQQNKNSLTLLFLAFGIAAIIMQTWGISVMSKKLNPMKILLLGLFFRSLSFMTMPIIPHIYYFLLISLVFSLFNALVQPMISTLITLNSQTQNQAMVLGLNVSYLSIANGIGPVIAGIIVKQSQPITYSYPLYLAGLLTFWVLILAMVTRKQYSKIT